MKKEPRRPEVRGKFIYKNNNKLYLKGVTYGTFKPRNNGYQFPDDATLKNDLYQMAEQGFNCIRTYTVPPKALLDFAYELDMNVMVGLPWEQHITFLDNEKTTKDIIKRVGEAVIGCEAHPAILCYTIGNEIPSPIVRWHGKEQVESFLKKLYKAVKRADPDGLVTYVNYPTTEYLDLSFLDFDCFNVYLESPEKLSSYLSRLHNLVGDRPLVMAEIGLDSRRNGTERQAATLAWQTETIFGKGCAGMFVFSWTDEWWRGGHEIEDWDFGLVARDREAKPALGSVSKTMMNIPFSQSGDQPLISVVVCSCNGASTIGETLEWLMKLNYNNYEVIVINDGSTDNLIEIVQKYPVTLISTPNKGLSSARNMGMREAKGEIIAYIDDDAYPDPDWLNYIAYAYSNSEHASIGGPNIAPQGDGFIATCVANAPGGPVHVLSTDEIAEHIPGCNMTFKKEALMEIGGFDPRFRSAGDDVDVCWRIQQSGKTIGFHPSALVWHHRRNSFKAYWKQQKGYGKAEALLEAKWPEKYNSLGHLAWSGHIYGNGFTLPIKIKKDRIFHGYWGTSLFQSVYKNEENYFNSLPLMPEWYLFSGFLGVLGYLGFLYSPLLWLWPFFFVALAIIIVQAILSSRNNSNLRYDQNNKFKYTLLIVFLHVIQPVARLYGRFSNGLTPWRKRGQEYKLKFLLGFGTRIFNHWSEEWHSSEDWLLNIEKNLLNSNIRTKRGDDFSNWDLQISHGLFCATRGLLTIEEHGGGKQYLKFKCTPKLKFIGVLIPFVFAALFILTIMLQEFIMAAIVLTILGTIFLRVLIELAWSMNSLYMAFNFENKVASPKVEKVKTVKELVEAITENSYPDYALQGSQSVFKASI